MADAPPQAAGTEARLPFWPIFEHSKIPMAILDRERRYTNVNDALVEFWGYPRSDLIGRCADTMVVGNHEEIEPRWRRLGHSTELYGERVIQHASGARLQVAYAAHVLMLDGQRRVLVVTLSARLPDGAELIGNSHLDLTLPGGSRLTPREREIVGRVALGANTRRIATELSLSQETVRSHVRNAMAKTGAHTRAHLVALALSEGLDED
jgi:PAS domain S-box-containing protein